LGDKVFFTEATVTLPAPHGDAPANMTVDELLADPRTLRGRNSQMQGGGGAFAGVRT
jgi:hypothetical protein